ncbi:MAG: T9SS type A sorting domain-containing protein [Flavobacteriales bacterium]|nr:MAG: T9SS type A sorting domain-containing protein [Flavobacteriales bacterium]
MTNFLPAIATAFLIGGAWDTIQGQTLSDNLIAHFPLDGSPDDTVQGLVPVSTSGSPGFCADRFGSPDSAACFDGSSFWTYGDVLDVDTSDFALTFWMRPDSVPMEWLISPGFTSNGTQPVCKGTTIFATPTHSGYTLQLKQLVADSYLLDWVTGGQNDDVHLAQSPIPIGGWMHVAVMRCDTVISMHLDGEFAAINITPPNRNLNTNIYFTLGALNREPSGEPASEWFIGAVDDVRLHKGRCLSQAEIDTLAFDLDLTVGMATRTEEPAMRISPNPASEVVRIHFDRSVELIQSMEIFDAMGRKQALRASGLIMQGTGVSQMEIPVSDLPPGAYFVVVPTDTGHVYGRFIKD